MAKRKAAPQQPKRKIVLEPYPKDHPIFKSGPQVFVPAPRPDLAKRFWNKEEYDSPNDSVWTIGGYHWLVHPLDRK